MMADGTAGKPPEEESYGKQRVRAEKNPPVVLSVRDHHGLDHRADDASDAK
eukprot:CAMPEP_0170648934 /NCGR_PEP_ID=MMETSP0224-20130122/45001_1 /TAXON_ID=285029 /ORGANISM="Togula jolla, Strain CCCM 725" /LENGTH=50 /DNA_ID=CAMNT_0010980497 /DNA_START=12 /DNA_END=165 /DNA_ORIENTATION=-